MILKNSFALTIRVEDYNIVVERPGFIQSLRALTLGYGSGMNHELNVYEKLRKIRPVECRILTAFRQKEMVGWALLSKEASNFSFHHADGYDPVDGIMFQVYVHHDHRRQGIATELLKVAKRKAGVHRLCVCPHDEPSEGFYNNFTKYDPKLL